MILLITFLNESEFIFSAQSNQTIKLIVNKEYIYSFEIFLPQCFNGFSLESYRLQVSSSFRDYAQYFVPS